MSWQIGAFAILLGALACGFAWYERRRPDARVVALVATLAALAALGRIAFAAVPNVKPTTDIVLIAGYALGPGPGFAVGAIAGLTSNFFFGQGPWTPWQMAAWGATGLVGAGLASLTGRRIGRWWLALVCAVVGFAFTAFQDIGDWVTYSDHSLRQLGFYVGQGIGFDAVHAAGCLLFALTFGPALMRSVSRFAARLEITWALPGGAAVPALVGLVLAGWATAGPPGGATAYGAPTPAGYLASAQNRDGGFGGAPGQASSQLFSGWAAMGLAAEGTSPRNLSRGGQSLTSYLAAGVRSLSDPGSLERTILAVRASGLDPRGFGSRDLLASLQNDFRPDGSISDQTNLTSFGLLALRAAGVAPPRRTLHWLEHQADTDGGFSFGAAGGASDVDDTGAVLEALAGVPGGAPARARSRAVTYIEHRQDHDGGFPNSVGAPSNAQSTAWAIQGLIAAGVDPAALHRGGAPSPLDYLRSLTAPDGHIRYSRGSDQTPVWVTAEAVMALAGKPLPVSAPRAVARASHPRPTHHVSTQAPHKTKAARRKARRQSRVRHHARARPQAAGGSVMGYIALMDFLVLRPVGLG